MVEPDKTAGLVTGSMMEPEEAIHRISATALALAIGVWELERLENDPVDHFQRKAGPQALEKQPTSIFQFQQICVAFRFRHR